MSKKFLCGRLLMQKDGSIKKLGLAEGGGARDCVINHIDMGFDEIHDRLKELFGLSEYNKQKRKVFDLIWPSFLDQANYQTRLYDFRCKELDKNSYTTFSDYIQSRGLRLNGIILYLCTLPSQFKMIFSNGNSKDYCR